MFTVAASRVHETLSLFGGRRGGEGRGAFTIESDACEKEELQMNVGECSKTLEDLQQCVGTGSPREVLVLLARLVDQGTTERLGCQRMGVRAVLS